MLGYIPKLTSGLLASAEASHGGSTWTVAWYVGIVVVAMVVIMIRGRKGFNSRVLVNPISQMLEQVYLFMEGFALSIIGPHGRKYLTVLCTFWLFIFLSNLLGLFTDFPPTADFSLNLGMAVVAIAYVQYEGIRANGLFGHLKHFAGPKLGGALVLVSGMIFLIELMSEAMKLLSLSLRLYGNIHGGHEVVSNLDALGVLHIGAMTFHLPVGGLLLPIKLLTVLVQALVFTLLLSVYLGLVTHHEEEGEHAHGEPAIA